MLQLAQPQGKYDEAKPLIERSILIQESSLGEHHPEVKRTLAIRALLSQADACNNMERAVHIFDTVLGAAHRDTRNSHRMYADISFRRFLDAER